MKITATIDPKIALAAGKSVAGKQEMELNVSLLTDTERALLAEVSASRTDGLEIIHYQHATHDMPALDLESIRAYLARIADQKAAGKRTYEGKLSDLVAKIKAGTLPYVSREYLYRIQEMPEYQILVAQHEAAEEKKRSEREEAAAKEAAKKAAADEAARLEMVTWIETHGSDRLRRCVDEGIECRAAYRDERLAAERPGWRWYDDVRGEFDDPRNPPAEAFAQLDAARKTAPDAKLGWHTAEEGVDDETGDDVEMWQGYVAHAQFLGRTIVLGGPEK